MTGRDIEPRSALRELRRAVRAAATPPAPAAIRAWAEHRLRVRRTGAVIAAAAAVAAVVAAGATLTRLDAAPAPLPAQSPTPTAAPAPTTPAPELWAVPPAPRPKRVVPAYPQSTIDDPITRVDWANATITVPAREDSCPSGRLRFRNAVTDGYPQMGLSLHEFGPPPAYGDLLGDERVEAVLHASCLRDVEGDHAIGNLLVVERRGDGSLRGVAWVGPAQWGVYRSAWVVDGTLFTEQQWSMLDYEFSPGAAAAYRWNGSAFAQVDSGLRGVETLVLEQPKRPIDLGADTDYVPRALGCPGGSIQFDTSPSPFEYAHRDFVYSVDHFPGDSPFLADLDGDGDRYVLVAIRCRPRGVAADDPSRRNAVQGHGILVLARTATGFRAVDVVLNRPAYATSGWRVDGGELRVDVWRENSSSELDVWVWNGRYFQER